MTSHDRSAHGGHGVLGAWRRVVRRAGVRIRKATGIEDRLQQVVATNRRLERQLQRTSARIEALERLLAVETAASRTVPELRSRIEALEADLQQERELSLRTAQLADLVTQLLAAAAAGDQQDFRDTVERYADGL